MALSERARAQFDWIQCEVDIALNGENKSVVVWIHDTNQILSANIVAFDGSEDSYTGTSRAGSKHLCTLDLSEDLEPQMKNIERAITKW